MPALLTSIVDAAERRDRLVDDRGGRLGVGKVDDEAFAAELGGGLAEPLDDVDQGHLGALAPERAAISAPMPRAAPVITARRPARRPWPVSMASRSVPM